ncbi:SusC/RagA family TonB-linked outer membrane protein [Mucilaginibacter pocheonensis]|uniref:TonB-linked SusC/RagA family outer membrane protein n=1 Tax=Mucilaginibacter pocheonensis TaxID=398050 RepID=A0ABU1TE76_9SPHI|nr:SusC/RagA family TonB-linked outer membrane protein [Mucilaginibacter pocheonensis]MDR6943698.1 TonB-linked SusC/RagA family outer membrane protein [Mucilaginibacter pocheonensis]
MIKFYILLLLMLPVYTFGQVISGTVSDTHDKLLSGVTVTLKGTPQVTFTNDNGQFKIKISGSNPTLVFTATNTDTLELKVGTEKKELKIILNPRLTSLDEVHVIAYGTNTQRNSVGSISKISSSDIQQQPVTNPLAALEGRVPGLVVTSTSGIPGSSFTVQVRGQNTLSTAAGQLSPKDQPLFIVDGVPFATQNGNINQFQSIASPGTGNVYSNPYGGISPFNGLNPNDIESIEVLKDADATAIYGSRGGNGVILITTKKGKMGRTALDLTFDNGVSVLGRSMSMMNTQQYLQMRKEAYAIDGAIPNDILYDPNYAPDLTVFDQNRYTDWKNYFIGNTAQHLNTSASISGGNANTQFRIASGFNRDSYVYPGDYGDNRFSFSTNLHHLSDNKKLTLDFTSSYSYDKNRSSGNPSLLTAFTLEPNYPDPMDAFGKLIWTYKDVPLDGSFAADNPYAPFRQVYQINNNTLNSNLLIGYEIVRGLTIRSSFGYSNARNNEFSGLPLSAQNPGFNPQAAASFGSNDFTTWIIEPQLEYKNNFKKAIYSFLLGSTFQENQNKSTDIEASGYINDDLIESVSGSPVQTASDISLQYKYTAVFARFNVRWDNKYLLDINGRRDGSSRFGPGKQFGNFGSAGAGWVFSEENFLRNKLPMLSFGKLRASYGITGSDAIGDYNFISRFAPSLYNYSGTLGYLPQNLANSQFGWATTKKLEFGLELGFLQDRFLITTAWYRNRTGNQLISYTLPTQTGFSSVVENSPAQVQNTGWEFSIQAKLLNSKNFKWNTAFNGTIPSNKLLAFPGLSNSSYSTIYIIGKSVNEITGFKTAGVNSQTGLFQFYDVTGKITQNPVARNGSGFNDYYDLGNLDPKFYGGMQNNFTYKNFQLSVFLAFTKQMGYNYLKSLYASPGEEFNQPADLLGKYWKVPGDNATFQRLSSQYGDADVALANYQKSNGVISDASYIRVKTVSLSYSFPTALIKKIGVKALRAYVNAQNLFTITDYKGGDPETQNLYGVSPLKTITGGLQLNL